MCVCACVRVCVCVYVCVCVHLEDRTHPESLLNVDLESSSSLGSHHAHAEGSHTKATAGVCTGQWLAVSRGTEVAVE